MRATDSQAVRLACLLDGSRMNREVHVRFCESPVVQSRRPTHRGSRALVYEVVAPTAGASSKVTSICWTRLAGESESGCISPPLLNTFREACPVTSKPERVFASGLLTIHSAERESMTARQKTRKRSAR